MIVELYAVPMADQSGVVDSPVSNTTGVLPDQEPALESGDLLGTFTSRETAVAFIDQQLTEQGQEVVDTQSAPFNQYTHIEWLTLTIKADGRSTQKSYYLVTDEGY